MIQTSPSYFALKPRVSDDLSYVIVPMEKTLDSMILVREDHISPTELRVFLYDSSSATSYFFYKDHSGEIIRVEEGVVPNPLWLDQLLEQGFPAITPSTKPELAEVLSKHAAYRTIYMGKHFIINGRGDLIASDLNGNWSIADVIPNYALEEKSMLEGIGLWSPEKKSLNPW